MVSEISQFPQHVLCDDIVT